jgi:hypothetical protein
VQIDMLRRVSFEFAGLKVPPVTWFVLQHDLMAERMAFFNVVLRCWKVQQAGWFVEISWNWNGSLANERWPVLVV